MRRSRFGHAGVVGFKGEAIPVRRNVGHGVVVATGRTAAQQDLAAIQLADGIKGTSNRVVRTGEVVASALQTTTNHRTPVALQADKGLTGGGTAPVTSRNQRCG